jgi:hypothetical protein
MKLEYKTPNTLIIWFNSQDIVQPTLDRLENDSDITHDRNLNLL